LDGRIRHKGYKKKIIGGSSEEVNKEKIKKYQYWRNRRLKI